MKTGKRELVSQHNIRLFFSSTFLCSILYLGFASIRADGIEHEVQLAQAGDVLVVAQNSQDNILDVLKNDFDPDGDPLTIVGVTKPDKGGAVCVEDGGKHLVYSPLLYFSGVETFSYTISDGRGGVASSVVSVTVEGIANAAPKADAGPDASYTKPRWAWWVRVYLDGSKSSDDKSVARYVWRGIGANAINPGDTMKPAVYVSRRGTYTFGLIVYDAEGAASEEDTVTIIVK